jgi:membrane-bound serine protease (ClpP class)
LFYLEINSPGIGWMGGLSLLLFIIVMYGHNVAGLAGMEDILLIILGMLLVLVELVFIPGFGFVGILGIGMIFWGLIQAMIIRYPGNPEDFGLSNYGNVGAAVTTLSVAIIGFGVLLLFFVRNLGESNLFGKKLVLANVLNTPASAGGGLRALLGSVGSAVTPLSPSGTVRIAGKEIDAISDGDYLDSGSSVTVTEISGGRVVVSKQT